MSVGVRTTPSSQHCDCHAKWLRVTDWVPLVLTCIVENAVSATHIVIAQQDSRKGCRLSVVGKSIASHRKIFGRGHSFLRFSPSIFFIFFRQFFSLFNLSSTYIARCSRKIIAQSKCTSQWHGSVHFALFIDKVLELAKNVSKGNPPPIICKFHARIRYVK